MGEWTFDVGDRVTRATLKQAFDVAGAFQGGIQRSGNTDDLLVLTDEEAGANFGYDWDGWTSDGAFLYTGRGQVGDQDEEGPGNRDILHHIELGLALRLFEAVDRVPGGKTKIHRHMGRFRIDEKRPFTHETALDRNGEERLVVVFRFLPVGEETDQAASAETVADAVPATGRTRKLAPQAHNSSTHRRKGTAASTAERRESDLEERFHRWLEGHGHTHCRLGVTPPGHVHEMITDTYDETADVLYEAKGTLARDAVRLGLTQLVDYTLFATDPKPSRGSLLLPRRPATDVLTLIEHFGFGCTYETKRGQFEHHPPTP